MASAVQTQFFGFNSKIRSWDHDPGATAATILSPDGGTTKRVFDMQNNLKIAFLAANSVPAGGALTKLEIIASASEDMSNPVVVKDSGSVSGVSNADQFIFQECNVDEIVHLDNTLRYVAPRLTMGNAGSEAVVISLEQTKHRYTDLTPPSYTTTTTTTTTGA